MMMMMMMSVDVVCHCSGRALEMNFFLLFIVFACYVRHRGALMSKIINLLQYTCIRMYVCGNITTGAFVSVWDAFHVSCARPINTGVRAL